ncbi:MAG: lamin tail domain-containing protein [Candidatus Paceibacteria bacterium]
MKYIFILVVFLIPFAYANAQVVINEVQISPIDERFIELYNMSDSDIDMTGWYLQRKTATGSSFSSLVTSSNFENKTIKVGGYFLISRNPIVNADIVLNTLTLTESNTIRLRNSEREDIDYLEWGNINEGESYQKMLSGEWTVTFPTPGAQNETSESGQESQQQEESSEPSSSSSSSSSNFPTEQQIFADAGGDKIVVVGADTLFEGKSLGLKKEPLLNARYVWNFGNGETKEGQKVLHYYKYPGEYVVMLNVSSGEYSATDRIIVNAYPAELAISKIEREFIEIHNKSDRELNLSWWQLQSGNERFMIPKDTIILANKKLIFSSEVTGLNTHTNTHTNTNNVSLLYPNGVEAVSFEQIKIPQKTVATKKVAGKGLSSRKRSFLEEERSDGKGATLEKEKQEEVPGNVAQTASVISGINNQDKDSSMTKWLLAIFGIVLVSAGAVVFMGKEKEEELSDEIEIIE